MSKSIFADKNPLKGINVILVEPQIPENLGLAARVLKNTNFCPPSIIAGNIDKKSYEVAKRARDFLEKAKLYPNLKTALKDSHFVLGATSRLNRDAPVMNFEKIKYLILSAAAKKKISIIFGRENHGLYCREAELCDRLFYIPSAGKFTSYNLSHAVAIVSYGLMSLAEDIRIFSSLKLACRKEQDELMVYMEEYISSKFKKPRIESSLSSLKRIFSRTCLTKNEVNLLKSLFTKKR